MVDAGGRAVPGARVVLSLEPADKEIIQVTTTEGAVNFVNLRSGTTNVTVTANGFGPLKQSVTVNENQNNFFTLSVGPPIRDKLDFLRPGWERRFARAFQYQYELAEQPGTVLADFLIGDETAFPPETVTRPIPNPQRYLQKHTLTLKLVELIPDRLALFKRGSDYLKKHPGAAAGEELSEIVCDDKPLITCLTRGGSWWQRAATRSGLTRNMPS